MLFIWNIALFLIISSHTTKAASFICYKGSVNDSKELPLEQSADFMNTEYIPTGSHLIIVIHGYSTYVNEFILNIIESLITVFGNTKSYCALNWQKEASAYIGPITHPIEVAFGLEMVVFDYPLASITAGIMVAPHVANALLEMKNRGLPLEPLYIMGHSEGAPLSGNIARHLKAKGINIDRITGMDPAKPSLQLALTKESGAKLVDCVHTDPGGLGSNNTVCDIDFWINNPCKIQPNCPANASLFTDAYLCSHNRAMVYQAEAILYPDSFQGIKADNFTSWTQNSAPPDSNIINYMGFQVIPRRLEKFAPKYGIIWLSKALTRSRIYSDDNVKSLFPDPPSPQWYSEHVRENHLSGSFYLCTNADPKYGKGAEGLSSSSCSCLTT